MIFNWIIQFFVYLALTAVAYVLMPKPKTPSSAVREPELPTAEAGRTIMKVWGSPLIKSPNVLHYTDKSTRTYEVKAG